MDIAAHTLPPAQVATYSTRLEGRKLTVTRSIWLALFAFYVGLFLLGAPSTFQQALILSDATRQDLIVRGISAILPALYLVSLDVVTIVAFGAIALFIVLRQPDDWMVMLSSLTLIATAFLYTLPGHEAPLPYFLLALAIALGEIFQVSFVFLFPIGQFVPRWLAWLIVPMFLWRPAIWVLVYLPNYLVTTRTGENYGTLRQDGLDTALMIALFAIGIGAQVYKYRRVYNRTQKLQTKWVLWGMLIAVLVAGTWVVVINALGLFVAGSATDLLLRMFGRTIRQIALFMVPLSLAFSILRYRLWDIDLLMRRTLIYAPLTAILAGLFAALIPLAQNIAVALTGHESIVATIAATMVVVSAIEPVKQTIQTIVDRKFQDTPDPERQLETFGERVQKRLSAVRPSQILQRFTIEAINAFQAKGGATFVRRESKLARTFTRGSQVAQITVDVRAHGKYVGAIALGERSDDRPYSKRDRAILEKTAAIVGLAIEQDMDG